MRRGWEWYTPGGGVVLGVSKAELAEGKGFLYRGMGWGNQWVCTQPAQVAQCSMSMSHAATLRRLIHVWAAVPAGPHVTRMNAGQ